MLSQRDGLAGKDLAMEVSHPETNYQNSIAENQLHKLTSMSGHSIHTPHKHVLQTYRYITLRKATRTKTLSESRSRRHLGLIWATLPQQTISKQQTQLTPLLQKIHSKGKEEGRQREERERKRRREGKGRKKGRGREEEGGRKERERTYSCFTEDPEKTVIGQHQSTDKYLEPIS